jgi:hypothetical protein
MSAYIVEKAHIDYLVTAALACGSSYDRFRWLHKAAVEQPKDTHERGEPWGPGCVEYCKSVATELTTENATEIGQMLWDENRRSVNHRYNDERDDVAGYTFQRHMADFNPVQALKSLSCYEYQSCEHPEWKQSSAYAFCETLRRALCGKLAGYEAAEWGAPEHVPGRMLLSDMIAKARKKR